MLQSTTDNSNQTCPHSKKMLALLDTSNDDYRFDSLKGHVEKCKACRSTYLEATRYVAKLNRGIPFVTLSEEMSNSLDTEIGNFVDGLVQIESLKERERRLKKLGVVRSVVSDIGKAFFSTAFLKGCAWALLASLVMKYLL